MSNTDLIIEERSRDIGDFLVGRLLPFRKKRMVGPFIFIDHMGPSEVGPGHYMDVGQHPHIGLSTLTYLFEGEVEHRDTTGARQIIRPGAVNWMVAGKGVVHTERSPQAFRDSGEKGIVHGFQIWVALPKQHEYDDPSFHHIEKQALPKFSKQGVEGRLVAGSAFGMDAPNPINTPLFLADIRATEDIDIDLVGQFEGEIGICVVKGAVQACEHQIGKGQLLVSKEENACHFQMKSGTHVMLFGGKAFEEERHIFWNFVTSTKERIEEAKKLWHDKAFDMLKDDSSYVPLP